MSSRIVKYQVCDSCGNEVQTDAVTTTPPGWGKLIVYQGTNLDLCYDCIVAVQTNLGKK